jgi:TRAP-type C4-dicarboxylate transport system substrate-binding protein
MKIKKSLLMRLLTIGLALALAVSLTSFVGLGCGGTTPSQQQEEEEEEEEEEEPGVIEIKCAHTIPATEPSAEAWIAWGDMIEEEWAAMKGAAEPGIEFTYYWSNSLLYPPELYDGVKDGTADMVFYPIGVNPGLLPMNEIFRLPFLYSSGEEAVCAAAEAFQEGTVFVDEIEGDGDVKFFSSYMMPPYHLHTASAEVTLPADVAGLTLAGEGELLDFIGTTDATPEETSVDQLAEKYNLGLIDGNIAHFPVQFIFGALDFTPHHTLFGTAGIAMLPCVFLFNPDTWDSLPSGLQDLIMSTSDDFAAALKAGSDGFAGFVQATQTGGHTIIELTEPQIDEWRALAVGQHDAWKAQSAAHEDAYDLLQSFIAGCA